MIEDIERGHYHLLTFEFFVLAVVHACYLSMFHTLISFIPHYATVEWHWSITESSYVAALPSLVVRISNQYGLHISISKWYSVGYFYGSPDRLLC
ncbi:hypothetical protein EON65_14165 [archaeon]|nr:MAG: hypothetical protein EON65_14165 [archaeon]